MKEIILEPNMNAHKLDWARLLNPVRVRELKGGEPTVKVPGESRSEFERDYGRTVYSTPFRRLRDKAQVFPLEPNDSVRTRLLHSLEVSSVAEDIATQALKEVIRPEEEGLSDDLLRDNPRADCSLLVAAGEQQDVCLFFA